MAENCTICNQPVSANYCANCGQKIGRKETTVLSILVDAVSNIIDLEKSVFASILLILRNPRKIVENYWHGNRRYYSSPGKILIYALAVAAIHLSYSQQDILGATVEVNVLGAQFIFWIIFFPLMAFTSYLAFIGRKQRFARHLVSILYISGCFFMIVTILQDVMKAAHIDVLGTNAILVFFFLVFVWNSLVFNAGRSIWMKLLGVILQVAILVAILVLITLLLKNLVPPEFQQEQLDVAK